VLGYNSAVFLPFLRILGRKIIANMDGIEWKRPKWSMPVRAWFWLNEWIAAWSSQRLVADHPSIADHLATRRPRSRIIMIPYGGNPVVAASEDPVLSLGAVPGRYLISVARVEPENNFMLIVKAFSRKKRDAKLIIIGALDDGNPYHRRLRRAAGEDVIFAGAIYDQRIVEALRFHARAHLHGHTVGGTNPSLVEALWAGNAVIAHRIVYNLWTAGDAGVYFDSEESCEALIEQVLCDDGEVSIRRAEARKLAAMRYNWTEILKAYEREFLSLAKRPSVGMSSRQPEEARHL